jgi:hypothetical protein
MMDTASAGLDVSPTTWATAWSVDFRELFDITPLMARS